jgi:predicted DCC family thiol-disulfide oxidoreductase YuxK
MGRSFSNFAPVAQHSIILFDGVCNLCNAAVQFVIKRDYKNRFLFTSLQSAEGGRILQENHFPSSFTNSFILVENGKIFVRSTAALKVARQLKGMWKLLYGLIIVPRFIRDAAYDIIARNRYRWFGKKTACMVPTPELQARFL